MNVLHLSDWHTNVEGAEKNISAFGLDAAEPDLVAVTGDMVWDRYKGAVGQARGMRQRAMWTEMAELFAKTWPGADLVAVPGNHDFCKYGVRGLVRSFDRYETQTITVGKLRITGFRGVPMFQGCWDGEFSDRYIDALVEQLDPEADIVLTHTPPLHILDAVNDWRAVGHGDLATWFEKNARGERARRRLHCFGHIHECGGRLHERWGTTFSNASGFFARFEL